MDFALTDTQAYSSEIPVLAKDISDGWSEVTEGKMACLQTV